MNKKYLMLVSAALISVGTFAQKDELKALKKIYTKETQSASDLVDFKSNLTKAEGLVTEEGDKVYTNFYKSMLPFMEMTVLGSNISPAQMGNYVNPNTISNLVSGLNATLDYEKKTGKPVFTNDINETVKTFQPMFLNYAIDLGNQKKYKESALILYNLYQLDKKDTDKLFYAASYATNAQDYDLALQYYNELKAINYSGEKTLLYAVNKASNKEESFTSVKERESFIKIGSHEKPRDEKVTSKRGEIYKNIALILVQKGKVEEAKTAIQEARKTNPEDSSLLITEANLYLESKDFAKYKELVSEALVKQPNNADLVFNLGVISNNNNEKVDAEKYYKRAIEIDPKYANAYLNLAILKLEPEKGLIDKMNKLGTSPADNKKYEVLKKQREDVFKGVIPYLEKAVELNDKNPDVNKTLLSVYNALDMTDKAKALKLRIK
jgi:tetratricopeptide (TPR) repeat protein